MTLRTQAFRFLVVGGCGFLTDAAVLSIAHHGAGLAALPARAISFSVAVLVTWLLNRQWSFGVSVPATLAEFARYLSVQSVGLAINFGAYSVCVAGFPPPIGEPLVALAVGSALAMGFNFLGARRIFARPRSGRMD